MTFLFFLKTREERYRWNKRTFPFDGQRETGESSFHLSLCASLPVYGTSSQETRVSSLLFVFCLFSALFLLFSSFLLSTNSPFSLSPPFILSSIVLRLHSPSFLRIQSFFDPSHSLSPLHVLSLSQCIVVITHNVQDAGRKGRNIYYQPGSRI